MASTLILIPSVLETDSSKWSLSPCLTDEPFNAFLGPFCFAGNSTSSSFIMIVGRRISRSLSIWTYLTLILLFVLNLFIYLIFYLFILKYTYIISSFLFLFLTLLRYPSLLFFKYDCFSLTATYTGTKTHMHIDKHRRTHLNI